MASHADALRERFPGIVTTLVCADCGAALVPRVSDKFANGQLFYGCEEWPWTGCPGAHGAHPDGRPLGIPANTETKDARKRAHRAFDGMWRGMGMQRADAYRWLGKQLGLAEDQAHIAMLTLAQCEKLIGAVDHTLARGRRRKRD